jgi:hypothetical protein
MGIIDFLSPYATKKKMAHLFKRGVLLNEAVLHSPSHPRTLFSRTRTSSLFRPPHSVRARALGRSLQRAGGLLRFSLPQSHHHHHSRLTTDRPQTHTHTHTQQATLSLVPADFYASRFQRFLTRAVSQET